MKNIIHLAVSTVEVTRCEAEYYRAQKGGYAQACQCRRMTKHAIADHPLCAQHIGLLITCRSMQLINRHELVMTGEHE